MYSLLCKATFTMEIILVSWGPPSLAIPVLGLKYTSTLGSLALGASLSIRGGVSAGVSMLGALPASLVNGGILGLNCTTSTLDSLAREASLSISGPACAGPPTLGMVRITIVEGGMAWLSCA